MYSNWQWFFSFFMKIWERRKSAKNLFQSVSQTSAFCNSGEALPGQSRHGHQPPTYSSDHAPENFFIPWSENCSQKKTFQDNDFTKYITARINRFVWIPLTVLCNFYEDVKSALQSREITLKENETILFLFHVHLTASTLELCFTTYGMDIWGKEKSLAPVRIRTLDHPALSLITTTMLSQLLWDLAFPLKLFCELKNTNLRATDLTEMINMLQKLMDHCTMNINLTEFVINSKVMTADV